MGYIEVQVVVGDMSVDPILAAHHLAHALNDFLAPISQENVRRVETHSLAYAEEYQFFAFIWLNAEDEEEEDDLNYHGEDDDDTPQPNNFKGGNPYA